ncbi:hypothetical protein SK128_020132 [Halocaridina rubra]|uniref:RING-type domain-containing protein n=1 Tax=Halocaridina rubra TaxID=373956 RepID=A0AAN9A4X5_HALRR
MSATVISKLESAERPPSPAVFPIGPERPLTGIAKIDDKRGRGPYNISQRIVPDEEDDIDESFILNLSMRSKHDEWNSQSPNASADVSRDASVSPSSDDVSQMDISESSGNRQQMDLSYNCGSGNITVDLNTTDGDPQSPRNGVLRSVTSDNSDFSPHSPIMQYQTRSDSPDIQKSDRYSPHKDGADSDCRSPRIPCLLNDSEQNASVIPDRQESDNSRDYEDESDVHRPDLADMPEATNISVKDENLDDYSSPSDNMPKPESEDIPNPVDSSVVIKPESAVDCHSSVISINSNSDLEHDISEREITADVSFSLENRNVKNMSSNPDTQIDLTAVDVSVTDVITLTSTQETERENASRNSIQEVVDVEAEQPCVVDLTCEDDDDDVDVVAVVEPVIFIGRGQSRETRRHEIANNGSPLIEEVPGSGSTQESNDQVNNENNPGAEGGRHEDVWHINNSPEIDMGNPNLTFGSLLEQAAVETVDIDNQHQENPPLHHHQLRPRPPREVRALRQRRRRSGSRSRSPLIFPGLGFADDHDDLGDAGFVNSLEGFMTDFHNWFPPTQLPLDANHHDEEEDNLRLQRVPPGPAPSPPPVEQPTISCLVCLDSVATIHTSGRSLCSTTCGHVFCSTCISEVVKQRKQCPVCRKRLTKKQYHPLFI